MKFLRPNLLLLVAVALLVLACAVSQFIGTIPPQTWTFNVMEGMKRSILQYAAANDSLPTSPEQFSHRYGNHFGTTDGWGREVTWRVDGDTVTLTSYGRDGRPGGDGEDADIVGVFCAKTGDGKWADKLGEWQCDPLEGRQ